MSHQQKSTDNINISVIGDIYLILKALLTLYIAILKVMNDIILPSKLLISSYSKGIAEL